MCRAHCERLRFILQNALHNPSDQNMFFLKRKHLFCNVHQLYSLNKKCGKKATNLHAILYAKYCTERFIIDERYLKENNICFVNEDDKIKSQFADLLERPNIGTQEDLDHEYLKIVQPGFPNSDHFYVISRRMKTMTFADELMREPFLFAAHETTLYLEQELRKDIQNLTPWQERLMHWLHEHRFVSGWITASAICSISLATTFA